MKRGFLAAVLMLAMGAACSHLTGSSVLPSESSGEPPSATPLTAYRVLFDFDDHNGDAPEAPVTALNGTLYGTTYLGGTGEGGTVFRMTPSGDLRVLHKFTGSDGFRPLGALTVLNGKLYGTTVYGGKYGLGTVFSITTTGQEGVLHSFAGGSDGEYPEQRLTVRDGNLYSTTILGGGGGCSYGCGTVFQVNTAGEERVVYRFKGGNDGDGPESGLTLLKDVFYGTTAVGGTSNVERSSQ